MFFKRHQVMHNPAGELEDSLEHNLSFLGAKKLQHHSHLLFSANKKYLYMCITLHLQSSNGLKPESAVAKKNRLVV